MQKNKYDTTSGKGELLKYLQSKVYETTPDVNGYFADSYGRLIACRKTLTLTQDSTYKTQFYNEDLRNAITPLNEYTQFYLYKADGTELKASLIGAELSQDYASIVCQVESDIATVSIVIYCGPTEEDLLLKDGSVTMTGDYVPTESTDIATKGYADDLIQDFVAKSYALKTIYFDSYQKGYYYQDNLLYSKIIYRNVKSTKKDNTLTLYIEPFAIQNDMLSSDTNLILLINNISYYATNVASIQDGTNISRWQMTSSENIYTDDVDSFYWKNGYSVKIDFSKFTDLTTDTSTTIKFQVKLKAGNTERFSDTLTVQTDTYVDTADMKASATWLDSNINKYKTNIISGKAYLPDTDDVYTLPVTLTIQNTTLNRYRCAIPFKLLVKSTDSEYTYNVELTPTTFQPLTATLSFDTEIEFNRYSDSLWLQAYNLSGELVYEEKIVSLDLETNTSDESNRRTTPSAEDLNPKDYGSTWDSSKTLESWEPYLKDGVYYCDDTNSALCFEVENITDCYSNITVDIEHDGHMYLISEGNTEWLDCEEMFVPYKSTQTGCKVNDNYFTFGRNVYRSKVFIRILGASQVKFNSAYVS